MVNGSLYDRLYLVCADVSDVLAFTLFGVEALVGPTYGEGAAGAESPLGNEGTTNCHSRGTVVAKLPL